MPGDITSTNLTNSLTAAKGWFDMSSLDFAAMFDTAVTANLPDGRVMHTNLIGRYPKNCTVKTGLTSTSMPLFLWHGKTAYDVRNAAALPNNVFMMQAIGPTGVANMLVATGGYELETTEYDTTNVNGYTANVLLTAIAADTNTITGGLITNKGAAISGIVKQFTDTVCGCVSRGLFVNGDGVSVLAFWPTFIPGTAPS